jgi:hypothetical protein
VGRRHELQSDYWAVSTPASFANTTAAEDPTHRPRPCACGSQCKSHGRLVPELEELPNSIEMPDSSDDSDDSVWSALYDSGDEEGEDSVGSGDA